MDSWQMIKALALYAEIEGMKVANKVRELDGLAMAYDEADFMNLSIELRQLATM